MQELGYLELLEQEEVQAGILTANRRDEKERASECLGERLLQVLLPGASPGAGGPAGSLALRQGMATSGNLSVPAPLSVPQCCRLSAGSTLLSAEGCQQKPWKR